jgi:hypothetical protein
VIPFKKRRTGDYQLDAVQDAVDDSIRSVQLCPLLDGVLLKDVKLVAAGFTQVEHDLGRVPVGYAVLRRNANAVVYDDFTGNESLADRCLKLRSSADVTVTLWVF